MAEWTKNPKIHPFIRDVFQKFPVIENPKTPTCRVRRSFVFSFLASIHAINVVPGGGDCILQETHERDQVVCKCIGYVALRCLVVVRWNEHARTGVEHSVAGSRSNDPNSSRETERNQRESPSCSNLFSWWWNGIIFMFLE